jgi:hypothetical protein
MKSDKPSRTTRRTAKPDFIPLDPRYVLDRLAIMEKDQADHREYQKKEAEIAARTAAQRDREMLSSIEKAVGAAVREASAGQAAFLDERFGRLAAEVKLIVEPLRSCIDEESRRRELLEAEVHQIPDREEFERFVKHEDADRHDLELQITGVAASFRSELFDDGGVEPRLRAVEDAIPKELDERLRAVEQTPGRTVLTIAGAVGATALTIKGPAIFEWLKHLFSKGVAP